MALLRSAEGCPWDREQTLQTLKSYCLEECYEVLDAIDSGSAEEHRDELGDLLLQVIFQAQIRREEGVFNALDVCRAITEKLLRRHPEIFANTSDSGGQTPLRRSAEEAHQAWEAIKASERADRPDQAHSTLSGIPRGLPALLRAQRLSQKAALVGFDWKRPVDVLPKVREEWEELTEALAEAGPGSARAADELGDLLFAVTNLARHLEIDAEDALRKSGDRFEGRFRAMEEVASAEGRPLSERDAVELEDMWEAAKRKRGEGSRA
jgi:MazG family protein